MSAHRDLHPNYNAALSIARRHESGARWTEAARAYLNVLVTHHELEEISLAGLERCARQDQRHLASGDEPSREGDDKLSLPHILLIAGHALCGRWRETFRIIEERELQPRLLSESTMRRWDLLCERLRAHFSQAEVPGDSSPSAVDWIVLLAALDLVAQQGYVGEAMMMCQHALDHLQQSVHQAIIHYEAGRIGVHHKRYASGALALRSALRLSPALSREISEVIDAVMSAPDALDDRYDDLISLRCVELPLEQIEHWVVELADRADIARPAFVLWLGERLEHLSPISEGVIGLREVMMRGAAFQCYAIAINESTSGEPLHIKSFDHLARLALARLGVPPPKELDADEPTLDTEDSVEPASVSEQVAQELVEEAESRLLIQLKDLQAFSLIELFLERKAHAHHLTRSERASAFNALAHIAFSARGSLREAVAFTWQGAQLSAREMKVSVFLKEAQQTDDWPSLERLLRVQLKLTLGHEKRRTLLRALAQGYRRDRKWIDAYDCLIEAGWEHLRATESAPEESDRESMYRLTLAEKSEREIASLLRVKGAALSIGEELALAGQWADLMRLIERLQVKGAVARDLLVRGVQSPEAFRFAQPLLDLYRREERWDHWINLILSAPRESWTIDEWGPLIEDALSHSVDWVPELRTRLLKVRAEWLREEGAPLEKQSEAWRAYLDEHPADLSALEEFEQCAGQLDRWTDVAMAYERALPHRKTGKVRMLERLADIYEREVKSVEDTARSWRMLLDLSPSHEDAGSWLTLHYARQHDWYHVLLICALWSPKNEHHPVWIESKLRGHLGLEELSEAYFWWGQLTHIQRQLPFVRDLINLAARHKSGEHVLTLLHQLEHTFYDLLDISPPDSSATDSFESTSDTYAGDVSGDVDSFTGSIDSTLSEQLDEEKVLQSPLERLKLKARALLWLSPPDLIDAASAWAEVARECPRDREVMLNLARIYAQTHQRPPLLKLLNVIDEEREVVITHRQMIIESAISLETCFRDYTEAFKCWLALYEHSPSDRALCIATFERLAAQDAELLPLLHDLYRILASHTPSKRLKSRYLYRLAQSCEEYPQHWSTGYEALCDLIKLGGSQGWEASLRLAAFATPLARWREAAEVIASLKDWRAKRLAAEIMETREGDHQEALRLYQEACQYCELAKGAQAHGALHELQRSLERVSRALRRRGPTPPSHNTPPRLKLLPSQLLSLVEPEFSSSLGDNEELSALLDEMREVAEEMGGDEPSQLELLERLDTDPPQPEIVEASEPESIDLLEEQDPRSEATEEAERDTGDQQLDDIERGQQEALSTNSEPSLSANMVVFEFSEPPPPVSPELNSSERLSEIEERFEAGDLSQGGAHQHVEDIVTQSDSPSS